MTEIQTLTTQVGLPSAQQIERQTMHATAQALEAHFLAEMLKAAGLHEQVTTFGGGPGEDQFASVLRQAQAEQMVEAGGIGLAESFYQAMLDQSGDRA